MMGYLYIFGTILFTVYGQIVIKWRVMEAGPFPKNWAGRAGFIFALVANPWVLSSLLAGFSAFLCWIMVLTKFELNFSYPFLSLSFVLVPLLSVAFFHESVSAYKVAGLALIILGIIVGSR
jgi:multidrug transporter EmrE-like cation transporter